MIVKTNGKVIKQTDDFFKPALELEDVVKTSYQWKSELVPLSEEAFKASWATYVGAVPCVAATTFYQLSIIEDSMDAIPSISFNPKDMIQSLVNFIRGAYHFVFSLPSQDTFAFYLQDSFGVTPDASIYENYYSFKSVVYTNLGGLMGAIVVIGGVAIVLKYMRLAYTGGDDNQEK